MNGFYFDEEDYMYLPIFIEDMENWLGWSATQFYKYLGRQNYLEFFDI